MNPDSGDPVEQALNHRIIRAAADMARLERGRLTVLSVWAPWGLSLIDDLVSPAELEAAAGVAHDDAALELDRLLSSAGDLGVPFTTDLVEGEVADVVARFVRRHDIDLVVLGTVGRSGLVGMVMGNTAERVLEKLRASVLAIKPEGFVSPVAPA